MIVGGAGVSLVFDYLFDEPVGEDDIFHVALLDGLTGDPIGGVFEAFLFSSTSGQLSFDLSAFAGTMLGLQFELVPDLLDVGLTSSLTISNLQLLLAPTPPTTVPEPQSLTLVVAGLVLLLGFRSRPIQGFQDYFKPNQTHVPNNLSRVRRGLHLIGQEVRHWARRYTPRRWLACCCSVRPRWRSSTKTASSIF